MDLTEAQKSVTAAILKALSEPTEDAIHECGASVIHLLKTCALDTESRSPGCLHARRLEDLIELSHDKLNAFPFKDVPLSWRRLYTDSSILKAIHLNVPEPLDLAIILAGAPCRKEAIEILLEDLSTAISLQASMRPPSCAARTSKRRKLAVSPDVAIPKIRHAIPQTARLQGTQEPVIIVDSLSHWPALEKWSPSYFLEKTLDGRRLVPIEIGRSYTDHDWGQSIVSFRQFVEDHIMSDRVGYLAQYDLFAQIPSLRSDICIPDYCYLTESDREPLINAWFGPANTVSPLHTDPYQNFFCQVIGKKYVRLYNPDQSHLLSRRGTEEGDIDMSNTSMLDAENTDDELFKTAKYVEGILNEGECLYIPVIYPNSHSSCWHVH